MTTTETIWFNGTLHAYAAQTPDANIFSANERGLLLGESVFETVLVRDGQPQFWNAHIARLMTACDFFAFATPYTKTALAQAAEDLIAQQQFHAARMVLRITVTGGAGGRGLIANKGATANWLMQISSAPDAATHIKLAISDIVRLAHHPTHTHKTGNYLDNIVARKQALAHGADDAILLNQYQRIASATSANVFVGAQNTLTTPPIGEGALPGIIRAHILQMKIADMDIDEAPITRTQLETAPIILLTNSVMEVVPATLATISTPDGAQQTSARAIQLSRMLNEKLRQMGAAKNLVAFRG